MPLPQGASDLQRLTDGGYSAEEIAAYKQQTTEKLMKGGFDPKEVDSYWGDTPPNDDKLKAYVKGNVSTLSGDDKAKVASNPIEIFRAGLQHGATSLLSGLPELKAPENMGLSGKITYGAGQLINELPESIAGFVGGAVGGGVAGGAVAGPPGSAVGGVLGAGAASNALPTAMREILTDYYSHQGANPPTWAQVWDRASRITLDTMKAGAVGAAANVAGAVGGRVIGAAGGNELAQIGGNFAAASVAATAAGAAIEGQVPTLNDFVTGGALAVAMFAGGQAGRFVGARGRFEPTKDAIQAGINLRDVYVHTGLSPKDALEHAQNDPGLRSEILAPTTADGRTVTPGLKALAPPEPAPFKPEPQIQPPEPRRPDIAFGDSLAVGTIRHAGMFGQEADFKTGEALPGTARIGATTTEVLSRITQAPAEAIQGKDVLLSTGASNSPDRLDLIPQQIQGLKDKGARSITIMGVGTNEKLAGINDHLQKLADDSGGTVHFIGPLKHVATDGIHSTNYRDEISGIVGQHMPSGAATGEGTAPGVTTTPTGEKAPTAPPNGLAQYATGNARPGAPSSVENVHPEFANRIETMVQAMPPEIRQKFEIISGFRDQHREEQVYAEQHPGQPVPRDTYHSHGVAVDVTKDPDVIHWIDQNGGKYGVGFTLKASPGEQNHLEPTENGQRIPHDQLDAWVKEHGGEPANRATTNRGVKPGTLIAPTPESVTEEHLTLFRTLEGNRDGGADHAVSPAGAIGRNQILPSTAREYGFDPTRLQDPDYNDMVAKHIISDLSRKFEGNLADMLVAYNAGPARARMWIQGGRKLTDLPAETRKYLEHAESIGALNEGYIDHARELALRGGGDDGGWVPPNGPPPRLPPPGGEEGQPRLIGPTEPGIELNADSLRDRVLDIVGDREEQSRPDWLNPRKWISDFQAQLNPARRLDRAMGFTPEQIGAEDMLRQTYGSAGRAEHFIRWGILDPISFRQVNDASLMHAFEAVKHDGGNTRDFFAYLLAKRTLEKAEQGVETGVDIDTARAYLTKRKQEDGGDRYANGAKMWQQVTDGVVDYARDSGIFSDAQAAAMKALNTSYVTMRRIMDPEYEPPRPPGRNFAARTPTRKMEGSNRQIDDPLTATVDNIHNFVAMADRNRAIGHIINEVNSVLPPEQALFRQVKVYEPPTKRPSDWDVRDQNGNPLHTEWFDSDGNPIKVDADEAVNLLDTYRQYGRTIGKNDFVYYNNGRMEIWHTKDPDLAEVMRMPWPTKPSVLGQIVRNIAALQRSGITSQLSFPVRAVLHGQMASTTLARNSQMVPYHDVMKGFYAAWNLDENYQRWVANGGADSALSSIERNYVQRDLDRIWRETGSEESVWNYVRHPIDAAHTVLELLSNAQHRVESAARIGYFLRSEEEGIDSFKAAMNSRMAYLDHAEPLAASWYQAFSRFVPFNSVGWKDIQQFTRAMRERPVGTTVKAMAVLTAPTILNYAVNMAVDQYLDPKDRYSEVPQWERDMYWVLPPVMGYRVKIQRPYVVGWTFATMPEHFMDYLVRETPDAFNKFFDSFVRQAVPPFVPTAIYPQTEAMFNYNYYTGRPLIKQSLERGTAHMSYEPDTTEVSKLIGRLIGSDAPVSTQTGRLPLANPAVTDEFVRQWLGPAPYYVMRALEAPFKQGGKPWEVADLPFVSAFLVRQPSPSAQSIQDFYTEAARFDSKHADLQAAIRRANPAEIHESATMEAVARITDYREALTRMSQVLQGIDQNRKMTNGEKRMRTDQITAAMLRTAQSGLRIMQSIESRPTPVAPPTAVVPPTTTP